MDGDTKVIQFTPDEQRTYSLKDMKLGDKYTIEGVNVHGNIETNCKQGSETVFTV